MKEKKPRGRPKELIDYQYAQIAFTRDLHDRIKVYAKSKTISITQAVRMLVEIGLNQSKGEK